MLGFLGLLQRENMQLEGFFFYLLAGIFYGSFIHYLVAKVAGPLLFNRAWCGWTCWTAMVLDILPFHGSKNNKIITKLAWLRYLHFGLSLSLVLALWFWFCYRVREQSAVELYWLLAGNGLYYGLGTLLAYYFRDNRAFCKILCPIPVLQKIPSRFALLKIRGSADECNSCGACQKACPMDIPVPDYIKRGQRVLSTECMVCFTCVHACPQRVLSPSFGLDLSKKQVPKAGLKCLAHTDEGMS